MGSTQRSTKFPNEQQRLTSLVPRMETTIETGCHAKNRPRMKRFRDDALSTGTICIPTTRAQTDDSLPNGHTESPPQNCSNRILPSDIEPEHGYAVSFKSSCFLNHDSDGPPENHPVREEKPNRADYLVEYIVAILKMVYIQGSAGQAENMIQEHLRRRNTQLFLHELKA
jgi:hypothetical protein